MWSVRYLALPVEPRGYLFDVKENEVNLEQYIDHRRGFGLFYIYLDEQPFL